jgi:hypothetical protein
MVTVGTEKKSWRAERDFGLVVSGVLQSLSCWGIYRGKFQSATQFTLPVSLLLIWP